MAQRAVVTGFKSIAGTVNQNEMKLICNVIYVEEGMEVVRTEEIEVLTGWADTANQMKTKISTAVVNFGNANGYSALVGNNVIIPTFTKG